MILARGSPQQKDHGGKSQGRSPPSATSAPKVKLGGTVAMPALLEHRSLPSQSWSAGPIVAALWPSLLAAMAGTVLGTLVGERLLRRIPEPVYRSLVAALVLALGVFMLLRIGH